MADKPGKSMSTEGPNFLTVKEAADLLRISPQTVYSWVHQRKIPYRKHGSRLVFLKQELQKFSDSWKVDALDDHTFSDGRSRATSTLSTKEFPSRSLKTEYARKGFPKQGKKPCQ